ncbi:MAG: aldehyde dehydrogenase family protein, partial [Enterobacter ludwigii]|nr:aldehyde dehydrogenase family protein [Enterobacter ludwigii]
ELGGKSPNIFFADVMEEEDAFFDKALEGFALFAFNQGEVCTCPSRALVQESIYERFMERAIRRVESIRSGNPLDNVTQMGAQVSHGQMDTILNYIDIGKKEGADVLTGGRRKMLGGDLQDGYYLEPKQGQTGLVLGYGNTSASQFVSGIRRIQALITQQQDGKG